jgi:hypothetical protein
MATESLLPAQFACKQAPTGGLVENPVPFEKHRENMNKKIISNFSSSRWLREPLLHFLAVGALLFGVDTWRNGSSEESDPQQIVITEDDLLQISVALRVTELPPRGSPQFKRLIETKVREEVLYREALAMGLDRDDTIVKRRMAQKMDFLAEDLSALRQPTAEELRQWFDEHPQDFEAPPRITFRHIFFAFDEHGEGARRAAQQALSHITVDSNTEDNPENLGDPFMFQDYYPDRTLSQVSSVFGSGFSRALFDTAASTWAGPVESGFGWHLVYIDSLTPARLPEFEEVESEVRTAWTVNQREEFKQVAYAAMRAKYVVVLPEPGALAATE